MKRLGLVLILVLAACSGGGGSPGAPPTAAPTVTPVPLVYTAKLMWSGPMAPTGVPAIAALARAQNALQSSNILLPSADTTSPYSIGGQDDVAEVQAQASPAPSSYPTTVFTTTSAAAVVPTPTADPSSPQLPPTVTLTATNTAQGGKTVSATIGAPVSQTVSQNIIIYPRLTIYCDPSYNPQPGEFVGGATWNGTTWIQATDISTADLYITGPACAGQYNDPNPDTIHFPGGGNIASNTVSFDSLLASSWTNAQTSDTKTDLTGKVAILKASGSTVKAYLMIYGNGAVSFVVETHGQGLDSF